MKRAIFNGIILSRKCSKYGKERIGELKFSRCEHQRVIFLQEHPTISLPDQVHQFPHKENLLSLLALTSHTTWSSTCKLNIAALIYFLGWDKQHNHVTSWLIKFLWKKLFRIIIEYDHGHKVNFTNKIIVIWLNSSFLLV